MAMNKKADERILSPWLFVVLTIIGLAIVISVWIFYSSESDVRYEEAKIMSDKLVYALSDSGYLIEGAEDDYDILKKAGIIPLLMKREGDFYFNITILREDKLVKDFIFGNSDFEIQCRLNGKLFAKCYEREIFVADENGKLKIKILTGSNQRGI